jgi:hypothetical protein
MAMETQALGSFTSRYRLRGEGDKSFILTDSFSYWRMPTSAFSRFSA